MWWALAAAALVLLCAFPDVIFCGSSLRSSRVAGFFAPPSPASAWIPERSDRRPQDGYRDLAGPASQLEPAQRFVARCLDRRESPYWNPYNGAGTHGPERLASASFSALSLLTALFGAGTGAWHGVLLVTIFLSVAALHRALTDLLGRSFHGALAGCFAFVLTGFHISMIGSQMVGAYLLAPILLLALLAAIRRGGRWRLAGAVLASALLLAETFVPTTMVVLLTVHGLCLAAGAGHWRRPLRDGLRQVAIQVAATAVGLLVLAPLWFPILESMPLVDLGHYEGRVVRPARTRALLSVATPKHFWESYSAFERTRQFDDRVLVVGRIEATRVYHLGIVGLLVSAQALSLVSVRRWPVSWAAAVLVGSAVGRTFGWPPFAWIGGLPGLSLVSLQYWGAMQCLAFAILLPFGFDAFEERAIRLAPTGSAVLLLAGAVGFLVHRLGWPSPATPAGRHVAIALGLSVGTLLALGLGTWLPRWRRALALVLLLGLVGELVFSMNRLRPRRVETDRGLVELAAALEERLGGMRVLQIGSRGLPPNWGSAIGIPQIDALDATTLRWYAEFFDRRFGSTPPFPAIRYPRRLDDPETLRRLDDQALELLAVRLVVVDRRMERHRALLAERGFTPVWASRAAVVLENPTPVARAWLAAGLVAGRGLPGDSGLGLRDVALSEDPELLRTARALGIPEVPLPSRVGSTLPEVEVTAAGTTRVDLRAELQQPAILVLADTWHPSWRATVDGQTVHVGRVDETVRGIALPPGSHEISFRYRPRSLTPAWLLSGLATTSLFAWALLGPGRRGIGDRLRDGLGSADRRSCAT